MLRSLFIIGLLLLIDLYVFQAFLIIFENAGIGVYASYWGISALSIAWIIASSIGLTEDWELRFKYYTHIRAFIVIFYIAKLFILLPLFIEDISRVIRWGIQELYTEGPVQWPYRSPVLNSFALGLGGLLILILTYGMYKNPFRFQKIPVIVPVENLPDALDGLKIVQISDLHSGTFHDASPFNKAIKMINEEEPDLVCFTGDLVNALAIEADNFVPVFKKIESKYGVYSILGNHDYGEYVDWASKEEYASNMEYLYKQHKKMGWRLLTNESETLTIDDYSINILGVENYSALRQFQKYGDLEKTWSNAEPADINLLLSHDPTHWDHEVIKKFPEIDLTLSGHTHGFQFGFELPGVGRWSPSQWVYNRWAGLYQEGNQYLYVNRGIGCLGYPGRVGILPEITSIKLKKA